MTKDMHSLTYSTGEMLAKHVTLRDTRPCMAWRWGILRAAEQRVLNFFNTRAGLPRLYYQAVIYRVVSKGALRRYQFRWNGKQVSYFLAAKVIKRQAVYGFFTVIEIRAGWPYYPRIARAKYIAGYD